MNTNDFLAYVAAGDIDTLREALDGDSGLVNARRSDPKFYHMTALQIAASNGDLRICKLLVDRGAEVYTHPMNSYPPVIHAAWNGHQEVARYFLEEIPDRAEGTNRFGVTIHLAARQGWLELVQKHIEADPLAVHQRGWLGDTPLHWPAHEGHVEIVELLLDAGAVIEADETNYYGGKPLHWASEHSPKTVELLLRRGADVNSRNRRVDSDFHGRTPLIMNAAQTDDCAEVAVLLMNAGADLNAVDGRGKTVMDYAVERGNQRISEALRGRAK